MSQPSIQAELADYKERIINNLTKEEEETLQSFHAEQYTGLDDEMSDDYEKWLVDLNLMDLEELLDLI